MHFCQLGILTTLDKLLSFLEILALYARNIITLKLKYNFVESSVALILNRGKPDQQSTQ